MNKRKLINAAFTVLIIATIVIGCIVAYIEKTQNIENGNEPGLSVFSAYFVFLVFSMCIIPELVMWSSVKYLFCTEELHLYEKIIHIVFLSLSVVSIIGIILYLSGVFIKSDVPAFILPATLGVVRVVYGIAIGKKVK